MKKMIMKEYEDVMTMLREVIMYQYEQSPNAVAFFRSQGPGARIDPLQRLTEVCTPDSLDHVCSLYEAYRSMVFHVLKEDSRREILHVTGFTDTILFTNNMLHESLEAQKRWHEAFKEEKRRIAARRDEVAKVCTVYAMKSVICIVLLSVGSCSFFKQTQGLYCLVFFCTECFFA